MDNPAIFKVALRKRGRFQRLLKGRPQTSGMKSGQVRLSPGEEIGGHDTGRREEILIILEGTASVFCLDGRCRLQVTAPGVAYIPARTFHNVRNRGKSLLRYVYVVSPV